MTEQILKRSQNYSADLSSDEPDSLFQDLVVAHAAVSGAMMANFSRCFAERLVEKGAELHFFASRSSVFGAPPPIKELEAIGGRYHKLPLPQHFAPLRVLQSVVLMTVTLRRLHVQVLHTRGSLMGIVGRIAAKLAGVPLIIHHQDDLFSRETQLSPLMRRGVAFVEKSFAQFTDRSLFISEVVLNDALSIGFPKEKCVLVNIDLNDVFENVARKKDGTDEPLRSRLREIGVPEKAHIVGCIARLAHIKGIDLFLEMAERLAPAFPEWVFVIKGDGPMREWLVGAIAKKALTTKIFLLTDRVSRQDMPALYRCFDLFALPTRREGFGMVFAEAMAVGIPVVGPHIAPVTEVVPDNCGILTDPENVEAFVQALDRLMSDVNLRLRLGENGRKHALEAWCNHQAAERVIDVYRELLNRRRQEKHYARRSQL